MNLYEEKVQGISASNLEGLEVIAIEKRNNTPVNLAK